MVTYPAWHDDVIREHYPKMGMRILELIPNRTLKSIQGRAEKLGVKVLPETKAKNLARAQKHTEKTEAKEVPPEIMAIATSRPWR